jgi:transposase
MTVLRKAVRRKQVPGFFSTGQLCLIGITACATAHLWTLTLLAFDHEVRSISPVGVKLNLC